MGGMNKYDGNTGRFIKMPEPEPLRRREAPGAPLMATPQRPRAGARRQEPGGGPGERTAPPHRRVWDAQEHPRTPKGPPPGKGGGLDGLIPGVSSALNSLLSRLSPGSLETEDLLLMLVLYLMYRESGDRELLIILGAMLFL